MLAPFYKFIVVNNSGQLISFDALGRIAVHVTAVHTASGKLVYTPQAEDDLGFIAAVTLADGAEIVGDNEIDNTANLFVNALVQLEITHDEGLAADGVFDLYIDEGVTTGELSSDASGYVSAEANGLKRIGNLIWESNGQDDEIMISQVFRI